MRRLTLVAAPAGYGKSTLLCDWVSRLKIPVAWITFDESDNNLSRFFQCVTAALQTVCPGLGAPGLAIGRSLQLSDPDPGASMSSVMAALVNEAAALSQPFILVFDDYHALDAQGIQQAVSFLLEHLPENLSLVIATRADPPLPFSRLRAGRQMVEVRSDELRFSEGEADTFLRKIMHLELRPPEIATLTECTEGWIAGLQMAALALRGRDDTADYIRNFSGRERFVIDYLFEEVLSRQPQAIQTFLTQTSILEQMTGPLCDAVVGNLEGAALPAAGETLAGQQMLEYLERANLFLVPLDAERCYYRYHRLFSDLLRHRLHRSAAELVPLLHARAADWLEKEGKASAALEHWIAAKNHLKAAQLIAKHGYMFLEQGNFHQLLTWLQHIPESYVFSQPWLCIFYSWALIFIGRIAEGETYLSAAEKLLTPIGDTADPTLLEQYGHVAAVHEYLASRSQDAAGIIHYADLALKHVATDDLSIRSIISFFLGHGRYLSNQYALAQEAYVEAARLGKEAGNLLISVNALCALANLVRFQGKLHQAFDIYEEAAKQATDERGRALPVAAEVYVGRARLYYEWRDFQSAEEDLRLARQVFKLYPNFDLLVECNLALANLRQAQGDFEAAEQLIHELEQSNREASHRPAAALLASQINLYQGKGNLAMVAQLTGQQDWSLENKSLYVWAETFLASVRSLIAQNEPSRAEALLEQCLTKFEAHGLWAAVIKALAIRACLFDSQTKEALALEHMQRALSLAEPEGFIQTFADEGEMAQSLIARCRSQTAPKISHASEADLRLLPYTERLLSAFPIHETEKRKSRLIRYAHHAGQAGTDQVGLGLVELLTERELEVLHLIAGGFSNKEIAEKLIVTTGTVKSHTSNIYRKLDVLGRTKALARARELHLL